MPAPSPIRLRAPPARLPRRAHSSPRAGRPPSRRERAALARASPAPSRRSARRRPRHARARTRPTAACRARRAAAGVRPSARAAHAARPISSPCRAHAVLRVLEPALGARDARCRRVEQVRTAQRLVVARLATSAIAYVCERSVAVAAARSAERALPLRAAPAAGEQIERRREAGGVRVRRCRERGLQRRRRLMRSRYWSAARPNWPRPIGR